VLDLSKSGRGAYAIRALPDLCLGDTIGASGEEH
jgi:hypothetical protein